MTGLRHSDTTNHPRCAPGFVGLGSESPSTQIFPSSIGRPDADRKGVGSFYFQEPLQYRSIQLLGTQESRAVSDSRLRDCYISDCSHHPSVRIHGQLVIINWLAGDVLMVSVTRFFSNSSYAKYFIFQEWFMRSAHYFLNANVLILMKTRLRSITAEPTSHRIINVPGPDPGHQPTSDLDLNGSRSSGFSTPIPWLQLDIFVEQDRPFETRSHKKSNLFSNMMSDRITTAYTGPAKRYHRDQDMLFRSRVYYNLTVLGALLYFSNNAYRWNWRPTRNVALMASSSPHAQVASWIVRA
ncbi:hypothetical protein BDN72DRAFT_879120 [Pluteus cervinus]|uniref:Uncharacterized protein n=1 Tax=Pluteus cervinus TaxID=181527 RepID=A0ACD3ARR1_9AGAR|nr:hypothetical protein BDN72DRAFT_879120 [Pluteus cervinus]